jgi:excisionase family DNA binding protein
MKHPESFISVKEVAKLLGRQPSWVYKQAEARRIPYYKVGHYLMFRLSEVEAYVQRCRVEPTGG